jgi:hypothetical protein
MAGLDFGALREPDYDASRLRQASQITEYIKKFGQKVLTKYFALSPTQHEPGTFVTREKNIFYDTDMIREHQVESVIVCNECSGTLVIETTSSINALSLGVEIPLGACNHCAEEGMRLLDKARRSGKYRYLKLINRRDKVYQP